jgi:hypothetical protein
MELEKPDCSYLSNLVHDFSAGVLLWHIVYVCVKRNEVSALCSTSEVGPFARVNVYFEGARTLIVSTWIEHNIFVALHVPTRKPAGDKRKPLAQCDSSNALVIKPTPIQ